MEQQADTTTDENTSTAPPATDDIAAAVADYITRLYGTTTSTEGDEAPTVTHHAGGTVTYEPFVRTPEVLEFLGGLSRNTLAALIRDEGLPCYVIRGSRRFILSEVREWAIAHRGVTA